MSGWLALHFPSTVGRGLVREERLNARALPALSAELPDPQLGTLSSQGGPVS